jgi:soluble lytic murein transglycosylase-like protein
MACGANTVPEQHRKDVRAAARECKPLTPRLVAAQIEQESGWDPAAVSPQGAQGIAQFMPQTWSVWGYDANGNGATDPMEPRDAIRSQGRLMCHLIDLARDSGIDGDHIDLALAAYNAGWDPVRRYEGIPPYPETVAYVQEIRERARTMRLTE